MRPLLIAAALLSAAASHASLTIQINYSGPAQYSSYFTDAADYWESRLVGYQDGAIQAVSLGSSYLGQPVGTQLTTVYIDAVLAPDDGVGGTLGFAGPNDIAVDALGYTLTTDGTMSFDDADAGNLVTQGRFDDVVLHEMAHVLGFGTLWVNNGVYSTGTGQYTGANALSYWQSEFGQTGDAFVPIEQGGGDGTADGHWDENENGVGATGVTDGVNDMQNELMTGWLNTPTFVSDMTIAQFIDIGFVGSLATIPEASSFLAVGLVFTGLAARGRRR